MPFGVVPVRPSGALTRYSAGNPIIPMGAPGSSDDEKTGPRVILKLGPTDYRCWYEAGSAPNTTTADYATSTNGKSWTKQGTVIAPTETWEGTEISPNTILIEGGVFRLWYHSYGPSAKRRIGYATSNDGLTWTKYAGNPVLDVGGSGSLDSLYLAEPRVIRDKGQYLMYYGGMSVEDQTKYTWMLATSPDGIAWTKRGALALTDTNASAGYALHRNKWGFHVWYGVGSGGGNGGLHYAFSVDGFNWTPGPNNPVLTLNSDPSAPDAEGIGDSVSSYYDGAEFRVLYTGSHWSAPRSEAICMASIAG